MERESVVLSVLLPRKEKTVCVIIHTLVCEDSQTDGYMGSKDELLDKEERRGKNLLITAS